MVWIPGHHLILRVSEQVTLKMESATHNQSLKTEYERTFIRFPKFIKCSTNPLKETGLGNS